MGGGALVAVWPAGAVTYEDSLLKLDLPAGWTVEGERGEYWLSSEGEDVASLLLLAPDDERPLEVRLAEIDAQFLGTGIIHPGRSETRVEDGEEIVYRSYRLGPPSAEEDTVLLHQYFFWRAGVLVLLHVESAPARHTQEDLFFRVFQTLEVREVPSPFAIEDPFPTLVPH